MTSKFDAIVVGVGPAGSDAAYSMAKAGLSVLVIERGEFPGSKNTSGAIFYSEILNELMPGFWQEAPVERRISNHIISFLGEGSSVSIKFSHEQPQKPIGLSVLRSKFDRWLAQKAADAGALILTATLAEDLILENGRVKGVKVAKEQGEAYADVVIIADGANSLLTDRVNLQGKSRLQDTGLAVKELVKLPASEIEQRFQLSGNEGAAYTFVGDGTRGLPGGCFLYTNKESLSIGLIVNLNNLKAANVQLFTLLDHFKEHREVAPLLSGGIVKEYSAHLIPEGGYKASRLYSDGVLVAGDAAGLSLNSGFTLRGMDFAIASGIAAAEAVRKAKEKADYSERSLSYYKRLLEQGFVLQDLKRFQRLSQFLQKERIYKDYPAWFCSVAKSLFTVGTTPRDKMIKVMLREKPRRLSRLNIVNDIIKGIKDL